MDLTHIQMERLQRDWTKLAGEDLIVEKIKGVFYAYGSELACLRLFYKFNQVNRTNSDCKYSENLGTWYFSLDNN